MASLGVQMFTLREHCKTEEEIASSLKRVKDMGYDGIQASAMGPIEPANLKKLLDDNGLVCGATHTKIDDMLENTSKVIDEHQAIDCKYTAIGGFWPGDAPKSTWLEFCDKYNAAAEKMAQGGISIGYHNHSHEFCKVEGQTVMDILVENLDEKIWFEIDTYWVAHGGSIPRHWLTRLAGRINCIHYKDLVMHYPAPGEGHAHLMTEIGEGNLEWSGIKKAVDEGGTEWVFVERDRGLLDPFESLEISIKNIKANGYV